MKRVVASVVIALLLIGGLPAGALAATAPHFDAQPGGGAPGVAWTDQPGVAIRNGNNLVESATGTIFLSIKPGTGTAGAVLSCSGMPVTLVGGVASFSACKIDLAGTAYRLTATWSQGGNVDSNAFDVATGGTVSKLGFTVQPARGTPSSALAIQPSVALQDTAGITQTAAAPTTLTLALGANAGGGALTCSGGLSKATLNGVAVFTGCRVDKVGVGYTLVATSAGLTSATSNLFDVADRLVLTTQPSGAAAGVAFATQPVVAVRAGANATAIHDGGTVVTLTIQPGSGAPGAILTCAGGLSKTVVAGVATFAGCSIDKASPTSPVNPYRLVATATGLTSATSSALTVSAGSNLTLTNSALVITWGNSVLLTARFDQLGANRTVQLRGSKNGSTWTTITNVVTNAAGVTSFSYRPATNLFYRAAFAGAVDLGALTSNTTRTVVRQISILRPTNFGAIKRIARGSSITFVDTVRPSRPELTPATVRFVFYRRATSGAWVLSGLRDLPINSLGQASTRWTFSVGEWYVRSQARPTPSNANSVWGALERYSVR